MNHVHGWAFPEADQFMANEMKPDGRYQYGHLTMALAFVKDWSCAIDGGAHVGTWSRPMSERFARVIAVEPSADTHEALCANLAAFLCGNVEVKRIVLGERPGYASMVLDGRGADLKNTGARYAQPGDDVPVETIDSWQLPSLGFLKLDVEGSEPAALRGARETLQRCKPIVIFEDKKFWTRYGEPKDAVVRVLQSVGYRELARAKMDAIWGPKS